MITLQVLNKIIQTGDPSMILNNNLDDSYFLLYEDQFNFINRHIQKYGNVPDKESFLAKFKEFPLFEVTESDKYLIEKLFEEHLYNITVPVATEFAEKLKHDANEAKEFLIEKLPTLTLQTGNNGIDIIKHARLRYNSWLERKKNPEKFYMTTGFPEIDEYLGGGWYVTEELVLFFARTEQGKSWVIIKCLDGAWKAKKRVALVSPEMSAQLVGFRFDTESHNIANDCLLKGKDIDGYDEYITNLEQMDIPFLITQPSDFNNRITVSKLRNYCKVNKIDILAIDGIGYLEDERAKRGQKTTEALGHISEDLKKLSEELRIPIIIVTHANRDTDDEKGPSVKNIKDSDNIACKATKIITVKKENGVLTLSFMKTRNEADHKQFCYNWDINHGNFMYIKDRDKKVQVAARKTKEEQEDITGVF